MNESKEVAGLKKDLRVFNTAKQQVDKALEAMSKITEVPNQDVANNILVVLKGCKKVEKIIEEKRKEAKKPFADIVKEIDNYAKELKNMLPSEIKRVKGLLEGYQAEQNRIEAVKQKKLEEEHAKKLAEKKASGGDSLEDMMAASLVSHDIPRDEDKPAPQVERTQIKGMKKLWKFEVTDASKVPSKYLIVDEKAVRQAIKDGEREISGIRIYQENSLSV